MRPDHTAGPESFVARIISGDLDIPDTVDWVVLYRLLAGDPVAPTTVEEFRAVLRYAQSERWTGAMLSHTLGCGLGTAQAFMRTDPDSILELPQRRVGKAYIEWKRRSDRLTAPCTATRSAVVA